MNIILLASNGNNIGKTHFAKSFVSNHDDYRVLSFARPMRVIASSIYAKLTQKHPKNFYKLYDTNKNKPFDPTSDLPFLKESPRGLVNNISTIIQGLYGREIWAYSMMSTIKSSLHSNFIIDDFRREIEYDYLKDNLEANIFTVYLDRETLPDQVHTEYEGLLKDFNFDIRFTFKDDYSNTKDLNKLIEEMLNG